MEKIYQFELKKTKTDFPAVQIKSCYQAQNFIRQFYSDDIDVYESFFMVALDASSTTIGFAKISQGGVCSTIVDTRLVCKYAIDCLAVSVIIAHNHPSGKLEPSLADINMTDTIKKSLELLNITLADHIIITKTDYYSFRNEDKL